jgi:hypothetical protein
MSIKEKARIGADNAGSGCFITEVFNNAVAGNEGITTQIPAIQLTII